MLIHCKYDELVNESKLIGNPKNANRHSAEQIDRLAKLISYHGVRAPVVVSQRSGFIVKGHGTAAAIRKLGATEIPVVYQNFESEEQETAFLHSDNAIAEWAELDLAAINLGIADFGPEFDIDLLGLKDFTLDPKFDEPDEKKSPEEKDADLKTCPNCGVSIDG